MGTSNAIAAAARYNFDFIPFSFYAWHGPVRWLGAQVLGPATLIDKDESSEHPQRLLGSMAHHRLRGLHWRAFAPAESLPQPGGRMALGESRNGCGG